MFYLVDFNVNLEVYAFDNDMDINEAHEKLGHVAKTSCANQRSFYGVKQTRKLEACDGCMHCEQGI